MISRWLAALLALAAAPTWAGTSTIEGTIRAADTAAGLSGVNVLLYDASGSLLTFTASDGSGAYRLDHLDAGTYFVRSEAPSGYLDVAYAARPCALGHCDITAATPIVLADAQTRGDVDLLLPRGGAISGRLREAGIDLPIVGADITVLDADGAEFAHITTTSGGLFLTPALPNGAYRLRAEAVNHVVRQYPNVDCSGGCDGSEGTATTVIAPQTAGLPDWILPLVEGVGLAPRIVYLNRCAGGCTISAGTDSAVFNRSSLIGGVRNLSAYSFGDAAFSRLTQCVRKVFAPYFIRVVTSDPGSVPHRELMLGGTPAQLGMAAGLEGVAPWACGVPIENAIAFAFSQSIGGNEAEMCHTATHELGHLFGLDHELNDRDTQSYALPGDEYLHFTDVDAGCFGAGPGNPTLCYCGDAPTQNTHRTLSAGFGLDRPFADGFGDNEFAIPTPLLLQSAMPNRSLACGTRTDRLTPAPAAAWIGGPPQPPANH